MTTTQKTLVLKTATVAGVKPTTPADRLGLGCWLIASYPANILFRGQFPLPHDPGSQPNPGSRVEPSAMRMREHSSAMASVESRAGWEGFLAVSASWPRRGDCQSRDRHGKQRPAIREALPTATAEK